MSSARRAHGQAAIDMHLEIWDATCHIYSRGFATAAKLLVIAVMSA